VLRRLDALHAASFDTVIGDAAAVLRRGGLVAFPTETVYGLGARARDGAAVARVYALKGRPRGHPLIVHVSEAAALTEWAEQVPDAAWQLAAAFWPGPLTLVLRARADVPVVVTGGATTVALRVPGHPVALALLRELGEGIAAPSANRFGRVSPTRAEHVLDEFAAVAFGAAAEAAAVGAAVGGAVTTATGEDAAATSANGEVGAAITATAEAAPEDLLVVLDGGACEVGLESTIVDLTGVRPRVLRPGAIGAHRLAAVVGPLARRSVHAAPPVPGDQPRHYAPDVPTRLVPGAELTRAPHDVAVLARRAPPADRPLGAAPWLALGPAPAAYGRELYAALRVLEASRARALWIERVPAGEAWRAVADRLERATGADPRGHSALAREASA
jgi:L-threonylcarbamoyladenylate synthase